MDLGIDFLAATRNGPTSIDSFYSRLDPYEVFRDGQITAYQFLQRS